ncbi:galectin-7 isoform X2 [Choloepus didactylus]|uniref:galectin-7 isoform X2 n=1 Tax=Choloepus didactylus TaxID=27675 RepID=UPI00189D71C6|nr:galectin-7 isoform X2 [Choloepus didactylus]
MITIIFVTIIKSSKERQAVNLGTHRTRRWRQRPQEESSAPPWPQGQGLCQTIPHKTSLPEGIHVGTVMRIRGVVPKTGRFHVNLLCSEEEGADAALHFNPRLDESAVVFNSLERGTWGREERGSGIPFQYGQPFEVLLIATDDGFKTVVGDSPFHFFRHRIPLARVRAMEVGGDLQLQSVRIF